MIIPFSSGNSKSRNTLIMPTIITIPPTIMIPFPHLISVPDPVLDALYICAPIISPTFALEAQHPISSPLPLLGNQLLIIARLTAHPTDYNVPSIILIMKYIQALCSCMYYWHPKNITFNPIAK
jgi:hypothetical protein